MIDGLKPYPTYRDSGVVWLGLVPEHWNVQRQRAVVDLLVSNVDKHTKKGERPVRLCNYVDVYKHDRITASLNFMRASVSDGELHRFRLRSGDVVITKDSEAWDDIAVPALVEYEAPDLVCAYHLAILRPHSSAMLGEFLFRALQDRGVATQYHVSACGVTRYGLSQGAMKDVLLPVPPLAEQAAIVRFLDHADRRIRRYIRAKQKLIKLLEEQKQAIIYRAVTRGLDADIRLKPSGVEWLGDVPQHWGVWQIGRFARVGNGSTPSRGNMGYWKGGVYPWLNSAMVRSSPVAEAEQFVTDAALRECHLPRIHAGSVLVAITGQGKTRGTAAVLGFEATINQHIAYITTTSVNVTPEFLHLCLVGGYRTLRSLSDDSGSTKGALTCEDLRHFRVGVPPLSEQRAITHAVIGSIERLSTVVAHAVNEVSLLQEYRTRLIADVVTGKLDVREAAAGLPEMLDEEPESEPLEDDGTSPDGGDAEAFDPALAGAAD